MREKIFILIFTCIIFFSRDIFASVDDPDIKANNYGVYTADNLRLLCGKNEDEKVAIASLTKIMTAIVCIENIEDLEQKVVVDLPGVKQYYDDEYSVADLKDKQEVTYYDLIATMLIPSGADSAACIALNVFGDYDKFIQAMNEKAKELGMNNTSFANSIGADDENNYSTVYDIAIMMQYALNNDILKDLMSTYEYTTQDGSITVHNALFVLGSLYGIDISNISGGKTGMTGDAGYCLVSYSDKEDETLICVVTGCEIKKGTLYHLSDSQTLYQYIKENYSMKSIISKEDGIVTLPTYHCVSSNITVNASEDVKIYMENSQEIDKDKITIEYSGIELLSSENKKGDVIGKASIYYDGYHIEDLDVVLDKKVSFSVFEWSKDNLNIVLGAEVVTIAILLVFLIKKSRNKKIYIIR